MPKATQLARLFASIVAAAVGGGTLVGCSSGSVSRDDFTSNICVGGSYKSLAGVTPKTPVDFLSFGGESVGTKCSGATDIAACNAAFEAIVPRQPGFGYANEARAILKYTRGNEIGSIASKEELVGFLSMTSPQDAALFLSSEGHSIICNEGNNAGTATNGFVFLTRSGGCSADTKENRTHVDRQGKVTVEDSTVLEKGSPTCAIGRRPEGLAPTQKPTGSGFGDWLARIAHLEAASVPAFERLAVELEALGAPAELSARARESAGDEVKHAAITTALARRFGGTVEQPVVADSAPRPLFEIALENAVEGCVRETFGALVATYQREHATDVALRAAMRIIARDETRHAGLSLDVAAWADGLLSPLERAEIVAAKRVAARELRAELAVDPPTDAQTLAGAPSAAVAIALFDAAAATLFS